MSETELDERPTEDYVPENKEAEFIDEVKKNETLHSHTGFYFTYLSFVYTGMVTAIEYKNIQGSFSSEPGNGFFLLCMKEWWLTENWGLDYVLSTTYNWTHYRIHSTAFGIGPWNKRIYSPLFAFTSRNISRIWSLNCSGASKCPQPFCI